MATTRPRRMLLLVAIAEILGMTLWFSATAAAPQIAGEFALDAGGRAWLTMAVQAGFVAGTLVTAISGPRPTARSCRDGKIGRLEAKS